MTDLVQAEKEMEYAASVLTEAIVDDSDDLLAAIKKARFHLAIAEKKVRT